MDLTESAELGKEEGADEGAELGKEEGADEGAELGAEVSHSVQPLHALRQPHLVSHELAFVEQVLSQRSSLSGKRGGVAGGGGGGRLGGGGADGGQEAAKGDVKVNMKFRAPVFVEATDAPSVTVKLLVVL